MNRVHASVAVVFTLLLQGISCAPRVEQAREPRVPPTGPELSTYSIVAVDLDNGDLGVAVQSRYFGVGPVVPWVESGVGAIATQSYPNTSYGPRGLEALRAGKSAAETLSALLASDTLRERRQVGIVDAQGRAALHTGKLCLPWAGGKTGKGYTVQGNILVSAATVNAMATAYEASSAAEELAERLMRALEAGQRAGGDVRGRQSAAIRVARSGAGVGGNDRYIWFNVEDHPKPIKELRRLLERHFNRDALSRARLAQLRRQFDKARQLFLEAERAEPDNAQISIERAGVEMLLGNHDQADATIRNALAKDPEYDNLLYQGGRLYLRANRAEKAIELLNRLVSMNPGYRDRLEHEVDSGMPPFARHGEALREAKLLRKKD